MSKDFRRVTLRPVFVFPLACCEFPLDVAALIWGAHPEYSRDQVAATLVGTAESKDEANPEYRGKLGAGLINAHSAVSQKPNHPLVRSVQAENRKNLTHIDLYISGVLDPSHISISNFQISDDKGNIISVAKVTDYYVGANKISLDTGAVLPAGKYIVKLMGLMDPFGQCLFGLGGQSNPELFFSVSQ